MTKFLNKFGFLSGNEVSPLNDIFHKVDDTAGHHDARPVEPPLEVRSVYRGVNETCSVVRRTRNWERPVTNAKHQDVVERKRRDVDIPFYYLGNGYTFNEEAYNEVGWLMH